jgi:zinc finger-like protein
MATPTPMAGEGTLAAVMPRSPSPTASAAAGSAAEAPMLIFLYFHKAIRAELEGLHAAAVRLATERAGDVGALAERCRFFVNIYKHHCDAEDAGCGIVSLGLEELSAIGLNVANTGRI